MPILNKNKHKQENKVATGMPLQFYPTHTLKCDNSFILHTYTLS